MSELQGPRIPGEERSARRRPLGWIIGGLLALLLLALLIPFACQAFGGGSGSQGQGSGTQGKAVAQEADDGGGGGGGGAPDADGAKNTGNPGNPGGGAEENAQANAQAEPAGGEGSQQDGKDTAPPADADGGGGVGSGAEDGEKTPSERGDPRSGAGGGGELPETGGMSPAALLFVGTLLLVIMGSTGLWAVVVRRGSAASRA